MTMQLYHRWACPYSARVRDFIDEHGLADRIEFVELGEVEGAEQRLADLTGGTQVPCLVVDGTPILESRAIIAWLDENVAGRVDSARR